MGITGVLGRRCVSDSANTATRAATWTGDRKSWRNRGTGQQTFARTLVASSGALLGNAPGNTRSWGDVGSG